MKSLIIKSHSFSKFTTQSDDTQVMRTLNVTTEEETICEYSEYYDYKIDSIFVTHKMIEQYTTCEDITELSKLLCFTHSVVQFVENGKNIY